VIAWLFHQLRRPDLSPRPRPPTGRRQLLLLPVAGPPRGDLPRGVAAGPYAPQVAGARSGSNRAALTCHRDPSVTARPRSAHPRTRASGARLEALRSGGAGLQSSIFAWARPDPCRDASRAARARLASWPALGGSFARRARPRISVYRAPGRSSLTIRHCLVEHCPDLLDHLLQQVLCPTLTVFETSPFGGRNSVVPRRRGRQRAE